MLRLGGAGLKAYVIQGNHDRTDPPWPYALCGESDVMTYAHNVVIDMPELGIKMLCLDYMHRDDLKTALMAVPPDINALALHQMAKPAFDMDGVWNFDPEWCGSSIKNVFLGDFHEAVEFRDDKRTCWYSGSTYMCSITEPVEKSFIDISGSNGRHEVKRVALETREVHNFRVATPDDLVTTVKQLQMLRANRRGQQPLAVVSYEAVLPDIERQLRQASQCVVLWPKPLATRLDVSDVVFSESHGDTLITCLDGFAEPGSDQHKFVTALLQRPAQQVFDDWRKQHGVAAAT